MEAPRQEPRGDDAALLRAAAEGDPNAVRRLLDVAGPVVYGYLYARVGGNADDAEDLLQETFLEAMRSAHTFRAEAAVTTWLCTIARRRLARHYEAERRKAVARAGLRVVSGDAAEPSHAETAAERDRVLRALGRLNPLHRQVLVLKYLDELSVPEIAEELGRTRTGVQSLLQRAREGLRRELERIDGP